MIPDDTTLSRKQWREKHKPVIRREGVVRGLAEQSILPLSLAMFAASTGGRNGHYASPDESAWWIVGCAAAMGLALAVILVRLVMERHHAPLSVVGAVFVAVVGMMSMTVVWARNEGVISTPIVAMFWANAACLMVGCIAVAVASARRPLVEHDDEDGDDRPE